MMLDLVASVSALASIMLMEYGGNMRLDEKVEIYESL